MDAICFSSFEPSGAASGAAGPVAVKMPARIAPAMTKVMHASFVFILMPECGLRTVGCPGALDGFVRLESLMPSPCRWRQDPGRGAPELRAAAAAVADRRSRNRLRRKIRPGGKGIGGDSLRDDRTQRRKRACKCGLKPRTCPVQGAE